jgi:2-polyprenyl-3-methyl-5-hydroxy-6-metoxy-1,4-benzoquinol methylase
MLDAAPRHEIYEDGRLHDLMYTDTGDFRFWVEEAQKCSGDTVLELACGTGNVCIALAQAGSAATGMDLSAKMLEVARQRVSAKASRSNGLRGICGPSTLGHAFPWPC